MDLPIDLRNALENELQNIPLQNLTKVVEQLSKRYRDYTGCEQRFLRSQMDVLAYSAYRLPATFAAIYSALAEIRARRPNLQPQTLLDVGAGPGTSMWAVTSIWPELKHITLLEREDHMIISGKQLATYACLQSIRQAVWKRVELSKEWECEPHEFVTAAYVLGELPIERQKDFINRLWANTTDTLLIVEPGTPRGFSFVRQAREQLIAAGAIPLAPCPHNQPCPMGAKDWCHFAQRISRTHFHRIIKGASLSYEDEKFSYIAMSRQKGTLIGGRVVRHPQTRKGHIHLELCTPKGLRHVVVSKRNQEAFRASRNISWGSAVLPSFPDNEVVP